MTTSKPPALTPTASPTKLDLFLDRLAAKNAPTGRLIFALDATASREEMWSRAIELQSGMFDAVSQVGGQALEQSMRKIQCVGGYTQIKKVLDHTCRAHDQTPVSTLIFVGDAAEEPLDGLCASANQLGSRGIKALFFLEGKDADAEKAFRAIVKATNGAFARFPDATADEICDAVDAYLARTLS